MNRKGFTLIELILVIAILGILAVSALPKFLSLSTNAENAARDGVVGSVRSGIALYKANSMVSGGTGSYPTNLEAGATCCFNAILENPVSTGWSTSDGLSYTYNHGGVTNTYTYNATRGTFQ